MEHVRIVDVADAGGTSQARERVHLRAGTKRACARTEVKNGFELARKDTQEKFTILCDTPDMKREWIRNIKTIVKEYQKAEYIANKDRMLRGTCCTRATLFPSLTGSLGHLVQQRPKLVKCDDWPSDLCHNRVPSRHTVPTTHTHTHTHSLLSLSYVVSRRSRVSFVPIDQNSDAWTLGLILWSMYTQRPLFEGFTPAQAAIALMTRQFHPEITYATHALVQLASTSHLLTKSALLSIVCSPDIPDSLAEILQDCWLENRDARPNFSMVYDQIRLLDDVQWPATKPFNL